MIPKTIKGKFLLLTSIFVILGVWLPAFFLFKQFRENFKERSKVLIEAELEIVKSRLMDCMDSDSTKDVQALVQNLVENNYFDVVRIHDEDGVVRYSTSKDQIGKKIETINPFYEDEEETTVILHQNEGLFLAHSLIENKPTCQKCHDPQKKILGYLDVESRMTFAEKNFFAGTFNIIFLGLILAILLFIAIYYIFKKLVEKPLSQLEKAFDELEEMNFNVRLDEKKSDEFGKLYAHFNKTVKNLNHSRKKIEELHFEQLQHADKLATLGELTSEIAHEINNPTAIISSRADYLALECEDNGEMKKYEKDIEVILTQTERISKITGNVLRYGRKLKTEFEKLNLNEILEQSLRMLELRIAKHKIEVISEIQNKDFIINADRMQLEQLIVNLINNAIDASGKNKKIIIRIYEKEEHQVVFEVEDEGAGMSEETRKNIFSPFFTTKAEKKGTGLGLYIVKNICENLGAQIKCESLLGKGSVFRVTFKQVIEG